MGKINIAPIEIGQALDVGIKRKKLPNQDAIGILLPSILNKRPPFFVVTDGMGGQQEGARASKIIIDCMISSYKKANHKSDMIGLLNEGIDQAHKNISRYVAKNKNVASMGAALAAAIISDKHIYFTNVGDVRIYLINKEEIKQISYDHSFVAEQVRHGLIKPEEVIKHPRRNVLTMSVTSNRDQVDSYSDVVPYQPNDTLLLCSDGLWGTVSETQIHDVLLELPPQNAADKLVQMANMNQGPDNISLIIAKLLE